MTRVKTCGLMQPADVKAAIQAGADYLGYIHFPPSPRHHELPEIQTLAVSMLGDLELEDRAENVLVTVDPDDETVAAIANMHNIGFVQLHGKESPERVAEVAQRAQLPIIKAVSVRSAEDVEASQAYLPHVHALLFDAKPPSEDGWLPGGNGLTFDWTILDQGWLKQQFWFLSGGLDAGNVAKAIELTGAPAVDVSSGIEQRPGVKDLEKIEAFVTAAKAGDIGSTDGT